MDGAKLSKSLIQFSIEGWGSIPSLLFDLRPNYGGGNEDNGNLPVPPTLQQATAHPCFCWRLLDTHRHVWVSLLWGHCSFLLGPGAQGSGCALLGSVSPVLCKFWWLYGRVNGNLPHQMAYAIPTSAAPRSPAPAAGHC